MSDDRSPYVSAIELHEEFVQHMEAGGRRMKNLALLTVGVAAVLSALYLSQLVVLPWVLGVTVQTVDLTSPSLMATEAFVLALSLLWLYTGAREARFAARVQRQVKEIRALEASLAKEHGLAQPK